MPVNTSQLIPATQSLCSVNLTFTGPGTIKITTCVDASRVPIRQIVEGALLYSQSSTLTLISTTGSALVHRDLATGEPTIIGNAFHFTLTRAGVVPAGVGRLVRDV